MVYIRPSPRAPARGLAGYACHVHRVQPETVGVFRPKPSIGRTPLASPQRTLPPLRADRWFVIAQLEPER